MRTYAWRGYTLIEVLVVLVILALAAAIAVPALIRQRGSDLPLQAVIASARDAAAHRGEVIYVRIEPSGAWHMEGGGSPLEGDRAVGRIPPVAAAPLTLLVSPAGSCAFDVRSAAVARAFVLEPLTCTVQIPQMPVTASSS